MLRNIPDVEIAKFNPLDVVDGDVVAGLAALAESAADALGDAADQLPDLVDRGSSTARRAVVTVGVIAAVVALVLYLRNRSSDDTSPS